jgi:UDP-glucose 4-epimerase
LEMIHLIGEATGRDVPFELAAARPVDVSSIVLDSTRITSDLGWYANGDISAVIKDMWSRNV